MHAKLAKFLPVRSTPEWLALATGRAVHTLRVRCEDRVLRLWLTYDNGGQELVDLLIPPGAGTGQRRTVRKGELWTACDPELVARFRAEITAFAERLHFIQRAVRGDRLAARYAPTASERGLVALYHRVQRIGRDDGSDDAAGDGPGDQDSSVDGGAYLAVVAGDWRAAMAEADRSPDALPSWVRPLIFAVSGDLARLQACEGSEDSGALGVFEALCLKEMGCAELAFRAMRRGLPHLEPTTRALHYIPLAELAEELEGTELAKQCLTWALSARGHDDTLLLRAVVELLRLGAFGEASRFLLLRARRPGPPFGVLETLGRLSLWCGQVDEARQWFTQASELLPDSVEALRGHAICEALDGDRAAALEALLRIEAEEDPEVLAWISELLLETGDVDRARSYLLRARARAQTPAHALLQVLVDGGQNGPKQRPMITALMARTLSPGSDAPLTPADVRGLLACFHGNRGADLAMTRDATPARPADLTLVEVPTEDMLLVSRNASAELLRSIRSRPVAELHDGFRALVEEYPRSPHPWCYWGELHLWLGEFDEAHACFEHDAAREARWAYVGRAAIHVHHGDFDAALAEFERVARVYAPVPGATTHVYQGELLRLRGELEAALQEFDTALSVKPGRVAAQMHKALCLLGLGRDAEAAAIGGELYDKHPRLFWDAARSLGLPWPARGERLSELLEAGLTLMRGNRSSHTITYFDPDGVLRIVEDVRSWRSFAARRPFFLEQEVLRHLVG